MKRVILAALALISVGLTCTGDPDPVSSPPVEYLVVGTVVLRPGIDLLGSIFPIYGQPNAISAVTVADSACRIENLPVYVEGNSYGYGFAYYNLADSLRLGSGDTATIRFVLPEETIATRLKLLTVADDTIRMIAPAAGSIVPKGSPVNLTWHDVPHADWYSVYYIYDTSYVFGADLRQMYTYTTDTTFTVPATEHPDDGEYRFFVGAVAGPTPGATGNVIGDRVTGSIYSWALPPVRSGLLVTIGSGPSGLGPNPDYITGPAGPWPER